MQFVKMIQIKMKIKKKNLISGHIKFLNYRLFFKKQKKQKK